MRHCQQATRRITEAGQRAQHRRRQVGHASEAGGVCAQRSDHLMSPARLAGRQPKPAVPQRARHGRDGRRHGGGLAAEQKARSLPSCRQKLRPAEYETPANPPGRVGRNLGTGCRVRWIDRAGYHPQSLRKRGGGPRPIRCNAQKSLWPDDGMGAQKGRTLMVGLGAVQAMPLRSFR